MILLDFFDLVRPENIAKAGYWAVVATVFLETGIVFCFWLPGDVLLFVSGLLTASGYLDCTLFTLLLGVNCAAILGNMTGFMIGWRISTKIYTLPDRRFFKKKWLEKPQEFFLRFGGMAVIYARFLPLVRTVVPLLAGVTKLKPLTYIIYTLIGSGLWSFLFICSGYYLSHVPGVKENVHWITLGIIAVASLSSIKILFGKKVKS